MRNVGLWIGLLVAVIILLIGFFMFRSPQEAAVPITTTSLEEEAGPGQLDNEVPPSSPAGTPSASPATTAPTASPAAAKREAVNISDTGFSPAVLTVPANTTVTFTNNGQGAHWPASDPHPTHNNLPGFDAKRGLATGETYSFTFTQKGTWGYHDHLNTSLRGSIVVQ